MSLNQKLIGIILILTTQISQWCRISIPFWHILQKKALKLWISYSNRIEVNFAWRILANSKLLSTHFIKKSSRLLVKLPADSKATISIVLRSWNTNLKHYKLYKKSLEKNVNFNFRLTRQYQQNFKRNIILNNNIEIYHRYH